MSADEGQPRNIDRDPEPAIALDAATSAAISQLVATQLQAAIEKLNVNVPASQGIPPENEGANPGGAVPAIQPTNGHTEENQAEPEEGKHAAVDAVQRDRKGGEGEPEEGDEEEEQDTDQEPDDDHQLFTEIGYLARRGYNLPIQFEIPRRFAY